MWFVYGAAGLAVLYILLTAIGYNAFTILIGIIEWSTFYLLPWIALYWFIQFVKTKRRIS